MARAKFLPEAPGFDSREWGVARVTTPIPWRYVDDVSKSPDEIARMFETEMMAGVAFWVAQQRAERRGERLPRPFEDAD